MTGEQAELVLAEMARQILTATGEDREKKLAHYQRIRALYGRARPRAAPPKESP